MTRVLSTWAPAIILPLILIVMASPEWPPWVRMWLLAIAIFFAVKWLTWMDWRYSEIPIAGFGRQLAYFFAWPGLDAVSFCDLRLYQGVVTRCEWSSGWRNLLLGTLLFWGVARWVPAELTILSGWLGMVAIILVLHFGIFQLLSCWWRSRGVDAKPLMIQPWASRGLTEFWGKRWNTAFRDLTHRFLFSPIAKICGPSLALLSVFLISGLVHDLVISWPVGAGYGWPTAYFLLSGWGILLERSRFAKRWQLTRRWRGRIWTATILALPAYQLFHPPFVEGVVLPFMKDLGALS